MKTSSKKINKNKIFDFIRKIYYNYKNIFNYLIIIIFILFLFFSQNYKKKIIENLKDENPKEGVDKLDKSSDKGTDKADDFQDIFEGEKEKEEEEEKG